MESEYAQTQSIDMDGEVKRWMAQMELVETGVNNLFGQVQILRNGRYIRTEQVYRKWVYFILIVLAYPYTLGQNLFLAFW